MGAGQRNPGSDSPVADGLLNVGKFFTRWETSDDNREGGRKGNFFYRDRWSHNKAVRSTHGVNCIGSCSWKVYVKDCIIIWEAQQTDYPSVGPDRPEYVPRGCPSGAAFSWYTYSPTGIRYPYARGVLLEIYREAKARLGDPVLAFVEIAANPETRARYQRARGKGGLVRTSWAEARYKGTNVVTIGPDYADNAKFSDEWLPAQAGSDTALAMGMGVGHVLLKEFYVDRYVPFFTD